MSRDPGTHAVPDAAPGQTREGGERGRRKTGVGRRARRTPGKPLPHPTLLEHERATGPRPIRSRSGAILGTECGLHVRRRELRAEPEPRHGDRDSKQRSTSLHPGGRRRTGIRHVASHELPGISEAYRLFRTSIARDPEMKHEPERRGGRAERARVRRSDSGLDHGLETVSRIHGDGTR